MNLDEIRDNAGGSPDGIVSVSPRLDLVMQQTTERFRASLEQRLGLLDGAVQTVEAGTCRLQQQQVASNEAHKLAGGLGLFGYAQAAAVAAAIKQLLQLQQPTSLLTQRLEELKRSLTMPLG